MENSPQSAFHWAKTKCFACQHSVGILISTKAHAFKAKTNYLSTQIERPTSTRKKEKKWSKLIMLLFLIFGRQKNVFTVFCVNIINLYYFANISVTSALPPPSIQRSFPILGKLFWEMWQNKMINEKWYTFRMNNDYFFIYFPHLNYVQFGFVEARQGVGKNMFSNFTCIHVNELEMKPHQGGMEWNWIFYYLLISESICRTKIRTIHIDSRTTTAWSI